MKVNNEGGIIFSKGDLFICDYIVFPEKLLNEKHNKWFRNWLEKHKDELGDDIMTAYNQISENLCGYLAKNGFNNDDFEIYKIRWKGIYTNKATMKFTYTHPKTQHKIIFDSYNGYWYTAAETGKEDNLVMFEWGDFYKMGTIFPIPAIFTKGADYFIKNVIKRMS